MIEADLPFKITSSLEANWLAVVIAVEALIGGANLDDAVELMRLDDPDRFGTAVSSWDHTTQSRVRRRLCRLGIDRMQEVINNLPMSRERPTP